MTAKIIVLILCFWPTIYEAFDDRFGEKKKDKLIDGLVLVVAGIGIAAVSWLELGYNPLAVLSLLLAIRFAFFDYITHAFLKRYSPGHKNINIWNFTGTVAYYDKLTAKVQWKVRLIGRILVLVVAVWWYLK